MAEEVQIQEQSVEVKPKKTRKKKVVEPEKVVEVKEKSIAVAQEQSKVRVYTNHPYIYVRGVQFGEEYVDVTQEVADRLMSYGYEQIYMK